MPFPWHQAVSPARARAKHPRQTGPSECSAGAGVRGPQVGALCGTSVESERGSVLPRQGKKINPKSGRSGAPAIAALLSPAPALKPAAEKVPAVVGPLWGAGGWWSRKYSYTSPGPVLLLGLCWLVLSESPKGRSVPEGAQAPNRGRPCAAIEI